MSLFIYKKSPDCLLEISERVYGIITRYNYFLFCSINVISLVRLSFSVFDCCLSNDVMGGDEYTLYLAGVASQLQDHFPEASSRVLVSNFGEQRSQLSDVLSHYNVTVMNYPCHHKSSPLLPLEIIHHFLKLSESWLSSSSYGQRNVLLLHCERGAWPLLAFMLSGLLLYRRKQLKSEEKKTLLELVYKQAPEELLRLSSELNPHPSQLRYLEYISRRNLLDSDDWLLADTRPILLDCLVLRDLPRFEGCRPILRVYGQDPSNRSILVFSTPKIKKHTHLYQQVLIMTFVFFIHLAM